MSHAAEPNRSDNRLVRWAVVAAIVATILGVAAVVITTLILRAIPDEGEVQVEIAGKRLPVGLVVSTDDLRSDLPGIVVDSLLGNESAIQINAGRVTDVSDDEIELESLVDGESARYGIEEAKTLNVSNPLLAADVGEGDLVAVITKPGSNEAIAVLTGVSLPGD